MPISIVITDTVFCYWPIFLLHYTVPNSVYVLHCHMVLLSLYAFLCGAAPYAVASSLVFWDASSMSDYDMDSNQFVCSHTTLLLPLLQNIYLVILSVHSISVLCVNTNLRKPMTISQTVDNM